MFWKGDAQVEETDGVGGKFPRELRDIVWAEVSISLVTLAVAGSGEAAESRTLSESIIV